MGLYFVAYEMRGPQRIALDERDAAAVQAESHPPLAQVAVPDTAERNEEPATVDSALAASGHRSTTTVLYP